MRRLLSLLFGWICVGCLIVAIVSVAIGDMAGAILPGFIAVVALVASAFFGPRSAQTGPAPTPAQAPAANAAAKAKATAKRQADDRSRREEEVVDWHRRNNEEF